METILPFVIAALFFGFQIYSNFKKEQEKARKRNPSQRPIEEVTKDYSDKKEWATQERKKEVVINELPRVPKYDEFNGVLEEVEEVRRAKKIHSTHKHVYEPLEPYRESVEENSYANFDLRDAVIKAAILERPYK